MFRGPHGGVCRVKVRKTKSVKARSIFSRPMLLTVEPQWQGGKKKEKAHNIKTI